MSDVRVTACLFLTRYPLTMHWISIAHSTETRVVKLSTHRHVLFRRPSSPLQTRWISRAAAQFFRCFLLWTFAILCCRIFAILLTTNLEISKELGHVMVPERIFSCCISCSRYISAMYILFVDVTQSNAALLFIIVMSGWM